MIVYFNIIRILALLNTYTLTNVKLSYSPKTNVTYQQCVSIKPFVVGDSYFMRRKICGIYKITSPSRKIYIGQSIDFVKRKSYYKRLDCKKQFHLYLSLKKYGFDKHKFEIIEQCKREELNERECYYIELFQSFNNKYGLNLRSGGARSKISEETRQRLRKSYNPKSSTPESIKKGVETRKNNGSYVAWNKGKKKTQQKNSGSFKIGKIGSNLEYILYSLIIGKSQNKIAKELGVTQSGICQCLKRKGISAEDLLPILEKTNAYGLQSFKKLITF